MLMNTDYEISLLFTLRYLSKLYQGLKVTYLLVLCIGVTVLDRLYTKSDTELFVFERLTDANSPTTRSAGT